MIESNARICILLESNAQYSFAGLGFGRHKTAQHSVHPTGGSRRVFGQFA